MRASYEAAVVEQSLAPVSVPRLEAVTLEPGVDLEFTASFEVLPEVELADLVGCRRSISRKPKSADADVECDVREPAQAAERTWHSVAAGEPSKGDRVQVDFDMERSP